MESAAIGGIFFKKTEGFSAKKNVMSGEPRAGRSTSDFRRIRGAETCRITDEPEGPEKGKAPQAGASTTRPAWPENRAQPTRRAGQDLPALLSPDEGRPRRSPPRARPCLEHGPEDQGVGGRDEHQ
jgi:hypothetical protein